MSVHEEALRERQHAEAAEGLDRQGNRVVHGNFIGAGNERDPIIGQQEEGATFTIPKEPVRRRIHGIETFNVLKGGEYFFMPSLSALNWLANLSGEGG